jgi:hypothetical protein
MFLIKKIKKRYIWRILSFRRAMAPKQSANFAPNGANGSAILTRPQPYQAHLVK